MLKVTISSVAVDPPVKQALYTVELSGPGGFAGLRQLSIKRIDTSKSIAAIFLEVTFTAANVRKKRCPWRHLFFVFRTYLFLYKFPGLKFCTCIHLYKVNTGRQSANIYLMFCVIKLFAEINPAARKIKYLNLVYGAFIS